MLKRRQFLGTFAAAIASAAFDPEKLLWVPGRKAFSLPPTRIDLADIQWQSDIANCFNVSWLEMGSTLDDPIIATRRRIRGIETAPGVYSIPIPAEATNYSFWVSQDLPARQVSLGPVHLMDGDALTIAIKPQAFQTV